MKQLRLTKMHPRGGSRSWKRLASKLLLDRTPWFRVFADTVRLPDGQIIDDFLRIDSRAYAVIFALTEDRRVLLVRGFKYGVGREVIQLPAGYLEPTETAEAAARRELLEETGYAARTWTHLGMFRPDGNRGFGEAHFFLARDAYPLQTPQLDPTEDLELGLVALEELNGLVLGGQMGELTALGGIALGMAHLGYFPNARLPDC